MIARLFWDPLLSCGAPKAGLLAALTALLFLASFALLRREPGRRRFLLPLAFSSAFLLPLAEALFEGRFRLWQGGLADPGREWEAQLRSNRIAAEGDAPRFEGSYLSYGSSFELSRISGLNRQLRSGSPDRANLLSLMGAGASAKGPRLERWKSPVRAALVSRARERLADTRMLGQSLKSFHERPLLLEQGHPEAQPEGISAVWTMLSPEILPGGEMKIELPADHDGGWLYVSDAYFPGWGFWVDGQARGQLLAEQAFRAVRIRPGDQNVAMRYRPMSLAAGFGISLLALVFALLKARNQEKAPR